MTEKRRLAPILFAVLCLGLAAGQAFAGDRDRLRNALSGEPFKDLPGVKLPQAEDDGPKTVCTSTIVRDRSDAGNRPGGSRTGLGRRVYNCEVDGVAVGSPKRPDEVDWKKRKRYYKPWVGDGFDRPAE